MDPRVASLTSHEAAVKGSLVNDQVSTFQLF